MSVKKLAELGLTAEQSEKISQLLRKNLPTKEIWHFISQKILTKKIPFATHLAVFQWLYPEWPEKLESAPAWIPQPSDIASSHISKFMNALNLSRFQDFHTWSVKNYPEFIRQSLKKLNVIFKRHPDEIIKIKKEIETPHWLPGAKLNIADSCFSAAPTKTAIIFQSNQGSLSKISYAELDQLSNQIANSLVAQKFSKGDAIAIDMPMTATAVAIYLGIIKMGGIVVSIADSFSKEEIATRLKIANAKGIFTQDFIKRDEKKLPLYEKVSAAQAPKAIVIPCEKELTLELRQQDIAWKDFLSDNVTFDSITCDPSDYCNILFSSGTTGTPKAIPWTHTTPLKAAIDAYFHHNIQDNDILAWPTNLGWMMGPWLIFAALMNQATIALYDGVPREQAFGKFIQDAGVTVLGVVPTLVAAWRQSHCMEDFDWSAIKLFSSTGECSNPEDMLYLMFLAGYKPIIEYCGGTEIGGSYITSTLVQDNYPSLFSTPALGLDFAIIDEQGHSTHNGEVALIPPAIGLSTELINANHHDIYFANMPTTSDEKILRRHGDQIRRLKDYYCVLGRVDDTMNLGAIKVSSAEIERVLVGMPNVIETAAIACSPNGHGPSQLVIFAAVAEEQDRSTLMKTMQARINQHLNPLFKIYDVVFISELPKTASNKIMRRVLRTEYTENQPKK